MAQSGGSLVPQLPVAPVAAVAATATTKGGGGKDWGGLILGVVALAVVSFVFLGFMFTIGPWGPKSPPPTTPPATTPPTTNTNTASVTPPNNPPTTNTNNPAVTTTSPPNNPATAVLPPPATTPPPNNPPITKTNDPSVTTATVAPPPPPAAMRDVVGRYVRIQRTDGRNLAVSLGALLVYDAEGTALWPVAGAGSPTWYDLGDPDARRGCTSSATGKDAYLELDLGAAVKIGYIRVLSRRAAPTAVDGCQLRVLDADHGDGPLWQADLLPATTGSATTQVEYPLVTTPMPVSAAVRARYLTVWRRDSQPVPLELDGLWAFDAGGRWLVPTAATAKPALEAGAAAWVGATAVRLPGTDPKAYVELDLGSMVVVDFVRVRGGATAGCVVQLMDSARSTVAWSSVLTAGAWDEFFALRRRPLLPVWLPPVSAGVLHRWNAVDRPVARNTWLPCAGTPDVRFVLSPAGDILGRNTGDALRATGVYLPPGAALTTEARLPWPLYGRAVFLVFTPLASGRGRLVLVHGTNQKTDALGTVGLTVKRNRVQLAVRLQPGWQSADFRDQATIGRGGGGVWQIIHSRPFPRTCDVSTYLPIVACPRRDHRPTARVCAPVWDTGNDHSPLDHGPDHGRHGRHPATCGGRGG
jgi:hypothetical protein